MEKQHISAHHTFELDVLRTYVTGVELDSFARAGERVGRSASAVSLQMRKLEEQVGQPLLRKQGRGLVPTQAGELLLGYARRMLQLNEEAFAALSDCAALDGEVRLGIPEDFAETWLPPLLAEFARHHPKVRLEARVDSGTQLLSSFNAGLLDIALTWTEAASAESSVVAERDMAWIGPPGWIHDSAEPLPLVLFDAPCRFRERATSALDRAGISWWPAFTSRSLSGVYAAVRAGIGITARAPDHIPPHLSILQRPLPDLGRISLTLHSRSSGRSAAVEAMRHQIHDRLSARA